MLSSPRTAVGFVSGCFVTSLLAYFCLWAVPVEARAKFPAYYSNAYLTLMALAGAVVGLLRVRTCSHSAAPDACLALKFFTGGLCAWFAGSLAWSYGTLIHGTDLPYPSFPDAGYLLQIGLFAIGILVIFKKVGANWLQEVKGTPTALFGVLVGSILTVLNFVYGDRLTPNEAALVLKFGADVAYSVGGALNSTLLLALVFGGALKTASDGRLEQAGYALLAGTLSLTAGDFLFSFATSMPDNSPLAYREGGWIDVVYLGALYLLAVGLALFPIAGSLPVATPAAVPRPASLDLPGPPSHAPTGSS
ncbi:MAG: hypothetical protein ACREM3_18770 [Candidatus Rokuibacteriota bacterium]